jgi:hypothetical protein
MPFNIGVGELIVFLIFFLSPVILVTVYLLRNRD